MQNQPSITVIELADISVDDLPTGTKYVPKFEEPRRLSKRTRDKLPPSDDNPNGPVKFTSQYNPQVLQVAFVGTSMNPYYDEDELRIP